jgi:DNA-binding Lrp family transcriptional regulator
MRRKGQLKQSQEAYDRDMVQVLACFRDSYPGIPTQREISQRTGLSLSTVNRRLAEHERKGNVLRFGEGRKAYYVLSREAMSALVLDFQEGGKFLLEEATETGLGIPWALDVRSHQSKLLSAESRYLGVTGAMRALRGLRDCLLRMDPDDMKELVEELEKDSQLQLDLESRLSMVQ